MSNHNAEAALDYAALHDCRDALDAIATELYAWASDRQPKHELIARMKDAAARARRTLAATKREAAS